MEISRNKQFLKFKLCVILSVVKSNTIPLHPTKCVNHSFVQRFHIVYTIPAFSHCSSCLGYQINSQVSCLCSSNPYFT